MGSKFSSKNPAGSASNPFMRSLPQQVYGRVLHELCSGLDCLRRCFRYYWPCPPGLLCSQGLNGCPGLSQRANDALECPFCVFPYESFVARMMFIFRVWSWQHLNLVLILSAALRKLSLCSAEHTQWAASALIIKK